jgi:hypothetical protein
MMQANAADLKLAGQEAFQLANLEFFGGVEIRPGTA